MKKIIFALLIFVFALLILAPLKTVSAKDYYFPRVVVNITIEKDGSFVVKEERTYKFDGIFSWATYTLDKKKFDRIEDFSIADENGPFERTTTETGQPSTFTFNETPYRYEAKFFYKASNTEKTFTISYKVIGGIEVYEDVADFYWKLVGTGWDKKTKLLEGYVYLPEPLQNGSDLQVFGHGPTNGIVQRIDSKGAYYKVENLPPNTYVEARVVFPSNILETSNIIKENAYQKIMDEELALAKKTEQEKLILRIKLFSYIFLWLAFLGFYLYLFFNFGKELPPKREIIYDREIPEDLPPAIVGYLLRAELIEGKDLAASILCLVKKGYIRLEVQEEDKNYILFKKREKVTYFYRTEKSPLELAPHLKLAFYFLFNTVSQGNNFTSTEELKKFSRKKGQVGYKFFKDFTEAVKEEGREKHYFENRTRIFAIYFTVLIAISILTTILIINTPLEPLFILDIFLFGIFALLSITLKKRTEIGNEAFAEWNGLKRFLKDFSNLKDYAPSSIAIWEDYIIYATTFGIAEEVLKQLQMNLDKIPEEELAKSYLFRSYISSEGSIDSVNFGSFIDAFTSSLNSITSSITASTGSGGGFSGGGGGGGGGSGGSAG